MADQRAEVALVPKPTAGADVAIAYLDEHEDAETTKRAVEAEGRRCIAIAGDDADSAFCDAAVQQTIDAFRRAGLASG